MEPRPAFAACVIVAPFREGDVVRLPDPARWAYYGSEGTVEWCRPSRIGVGPIDWVVSVYWPNVKRRHPT